MITIYPNDNTAYIGFYECINDDLVAKELFVKSFDFCKVHGFEKIVGPVDCSFWIKYRLKINRFDLLPYTGEPYNKNYYLKQFEDNGYNVCEHYTSQIYKVLDGNFKNDKFEEHYQEFINKGYKIVKPEQSNVNKVIDEIYDLLIELYSDFPIFKFVSKDDFKAHYSGLKSIVNMDLVRMVYFEGKAVAFNISIPNYNNLTCNINLTKIMKILKIKKHPKDYVMLYMGVDQEHRGLGKAISKSLADELNELKKTSIGALTRDGKVSQNYAKEAVESRYEYVLLEKDVIKEEVKNDEKTV